VARGRARSASAHPQALYRLLRALASIGVVAAVAPGPDGSVDRWERTELGRALREDAPDSQRAWVLTMGEFAYPVSGAAIGSDLGLLVMMGGRERTEREFRALFAQAGLSITLIERLPPQTGYSRVITAVRR